MNIFRNKLRSGISPKNSRWLLLGAFMAALGMVGFGTTPVLAGEEPRLSQSSTRQQLQFEAGFDSNRTLGDRMMLWGLYQIMFDDHLRLRTGVSCNTATGLVNALFVEMGYETTRDDTFGVRLKFLGNQYGEYGKAANSIIAYVNWNDTVYFIDFGVNYRFLNTNEAQLWNIFYYDNISTESIYYYRFSRRFVMDEGRYTLVLEVNNHDPMYAGNLGAYGLFLKNRITVSDKMTIISSIGCRQSGSIALSATYYKTMIHWGVEVDL
jgi:hypothetical protein